MCNYKLSFFKFRNNLIQKLRIQTDRKWRRNHNSPIKSKNYNINCPIPNISVFNLLISDKELSHYLADLYRRTGTPTDKLPSLSNINLNNINILANGHFTGQLILIFYYMYKKLPFCNLKSKRNQFIRMNLRSDKDL